MKKTVSFILMVVMICSCCITAFGENFVETDDGNNAMTSLTDTQRNSIGVLNYLSYLTAEIEDQKDQRMFLEEAYSSLYNNTYMNAIDEVTLGQVKSLLTTLYNFQMIAVKRERLEYLYEQNQAAAIRGAIPSPLAVMNVIQSGSWMKALVSVVYMAVDSISSYETSKNAAELSYLQSGWELSDEESAVIHNGHLDSIDYMWEIIHDYDLPADLAINENDINRFVEWKNKSNVVSKIQFLESNETVYQAFGEYWLTLAESYYENGDMTKCLEAVHSYETYSTRIFRKDYHYAKVLPMAMTAVNEIYSSSDNQYIEELSRFASRIISNTDQEDWVLRYFAAEAYVELAGITSDNNYLMNAYDIVLNNVNYLVQDQIDNNNEYLSELKLEVPADDATSERIQEVKQYNAGLKATRAVALPPISDALIVNCDLLFSLADELSVDTEEREKISSILYGHGDVLFLNPVIDEYYQMGNTGTASIEDISVSFDGKEIQIPAKYLTEDAKISVSGVDMSTGKLFTIDDWIVKSVNRKESMDINSFTAILTSDTASSFTYTDGSTVWIKINLLASDNSQLEPIEIVYSVKSKKNLLKTQLVFERIES